MTKREGKISMSILESNINVHEKELSTTLRMRIEKKGKRESIKKENRGLKTTVIKTRSK
jgi:hypothetical protein